MLPGEVMMPYQDNHSNEHTEGSTSSVEHELSAHASCLTAAESRAAMMDSRMIDPAVSSVNNPEFLRYLVGAERQKRFCDLMAKITRASQEADKQHPLSAVARYYSELTQDCNRSRSGAAEDRALGLSSRTGNIRTAEQSRFISAPGSAAESYDLAWPLQGLSQQIQAQVPVSRETGQQSSRRPKHDAVAAVQNAVEYDSASYLNNYCQSKRRTAAPKSVPLISPPQILMPGIPSLLPQPRMSAPQAAPQGATSPEAVPQWGASQEGLAQWPTPQEGVPQNGVVPDPEPLPEPGAVVPLLPELVATLNEKQLEAVVSTEGYICLYAGAGTGKTSTLIKRYVHIVKGLKVKPELVWCMTFTQEAAQEMRNRILTYGADASACNTHVTTFHAFALRLLNQEKDTAISSFACFSRDNNLKASRAAVLRQLYAESKISPARLPLDEMDNYISVRKREGSYLNCLTDAGMSEITSALAGAQDDRDVLFLRYLEKQRHDRFIDFDDAVAFALYLLQNNQNIREKWQQRCRYLMVDEFQDIDSVQYQLVELLAAQNGNLFVVGDPNQTIYSFRGSLPQCFTDFEQHHPEGKILFLKDNYRSQQHILDAAYSLIQCNCEQEQDAASHRLVARRDDVTRAQMIEVKYERARYDDAILGMLTDSPSDQTAESDQAEDVESDNTVHSLLPVVLHAHTPYDEARFVARSIGRIRELAPDAGIAVLYRSNFLATPVEVALINHQVDYLKYDKTPAFTEQKHIRELMAVLRLILDHDDNDALRLVLGAQPFSYNEYQLNELARMAQQHQASWAGFLEAYRSLNYFDLQTPGTVVFRENFETEAASLAEPEMLAVWGRAIDFISRIQQLRAAGLKSWQDFDALLEDVGYKQAHAGEDDFADSMVAFEVLMQGLLKSSDVDFALNDFVRKVATASNSQPGASAGTRAERQAGGLVEPPVQLMTVHGAKGLEFDYVFVIGINELLFPEVKSDNIEEERRLMYVAMTRAKKQLFLSEAGGINRVRTNGSMVRRSRIPSRFLRDIDDRLYVEIGRNVWALLAREEKTAPQAAAAATAAAAVAVPAEPVIRTDFDLEKDLNAEQYQAAAATEGYIRLWAGAGTGKTRTLIYRFAHLIRDLKVAPEDIWCVTFSNKAALEMKQRITALYGDADICRQLQVTTFHSFCLGFLKKELAKFGFPQSFSVANREHLILQLCKDCGIVPDALFEIKGKDFVLKSDKSGKRGRRRDSDGFLSEKQALARLNSIIDSVKLKRTELPGSGNGNYMECLLSGRRDGLKRYIKSRQELYDDKITNEFFIENFAVLYVYKQLCNYVLEFDDLILLTNYILETSAEVRSKWQKPFIMVDEFQDIDQEQVKLVNYLSEEHHNLFIVGDPDQTIYSFRGARVDYFHDFLADHSDAPARDFYLLCNYRSQQHILDASYSLISGNEEPDRKPLGSCNKGISPDDMIVGRGQSVGDNIMLPLVVRSDDAESEADFVADSIEKIKRLAPQDSIAVLYRTYKQRSAIADRLSSRGMLFTGSGSGSGKAWYDTADVKKVLNYLRIRVNPHDNGSLLPVLKQYGYGSKQLNHLIHLAYKEDSSIFASLIRHLRADDDELLFDQSEAAAQVETLLGALQELSSCQYWVPQQDLETALDKLGYFVHTAPKTSSDTNSHVQFVRDALEKYCAAESSEVTLADFVNSMQFAEEENDPKAGEIKLITIHKSKGLEFDYVFIAGVNAGVLPFGFSQKTKAGKNSPEERRLMYVAMTRARKQLIISSYGRHPSSFLSEIPEAQIRKMDLRTEADRSDTH